MNLEVGQQIPDPHAGGYVVTAVRRRSRWSILCEARKVFLNYRYREREFYPAGEDEHLPVMLRSPLYPDPADLVEVQALRELMRFEAASVLGQPDLVWLPEPLDLLEQPVPERNHTGNGPLPQISENSTQSASPPGREPILAMARFCGMNLVDWLRTSSMPQQATARWRWVVECLELMSALHQRGLLLVGFDPEEVIVDPPGRLSYLGTDRIIPARQAPRLRRLFPPERLHGLFAAPELLEPHGWLDARSDLYSWAVLSAYVMSHPAEGEQHRPPAAGTSMTATSTHDLDQLQSALEHVARSDPDSLEHPLVTGPSPSASQAVQRWCTVLKQCLDPDPEARPRSLAELSPAGTAPGRERSSLARTLTSLLRG